MSKPEGYVFGRPTKYEARFCQDLINHMANGYSFESFAGDVYVSIATLYIWEKAYPDFFEAKQIGRALGLAYDEKLLKSASEGKIRGYNFNAHKWKMANIHKWKDRSEQELTIDTPKIELKYKKDDADSSGV